jgi:hypothetical protein
MPARRNRKAAAALKAVEPHIQLARALAEKYDIDKADPNAYLAPGEDWSDLLNRIR